VSKALSSKVKWRITCCLLVQAVVTLGVFAQVSPGRSDLPQKQQVIGFLTESIDWSRRCAIERQIASDPADLVFVEDNLPRAAQIEQLSFDFARADAQLLDEVSVHEHKGSPAGSPDVAQFLKLQNDTALQIRDATEQLGVIKTNLESAHGAQRRQLQAALDTTQSRLNVLQAGLATLGQLVEFMQSAKGHESGDLASAIEELERTDPKVSSYTTPASQTQSIGLTLPFKPGDSGILALSSEAAALGRKLTILDDEIRRTNNLRQASEDLRSPLLAFLNKRLPAVAENTLEAGDLTELQQQKTRLDELAALVKTFSPAIVALDKQKVLLTAYISRLNSWRTAVINEDKKTWRNLITRLLASGVAISAVLMIGALVSRLTRRHMRETDRRHVILVIERVLIWATIVLVTAFAFSSDLASLATFFGLAAAGIAVALQNVIVAALGYFLLVSKRGIRLGDRLEISGVAGDVTDIGWLQFQLREIDKETKQPTGRTVTFSNSFVFLSPATGLCRFNRDDLKPARLEVAGQASQN